MSISDFLSSQGNQSPATDRVGIAGFKTLSRVNESYEYSSEAPTTYLEDGSSVEDNIVLNPVSLSIEGVVSDQFIQQNPPAPLQRQLSPEIGAISLFSPVRSAAQVQRVQGVINETQQEFNQLDSLVSQGEQALSITGDQSASAGNQQKFVETMRQLHLSKQTCDIEMPFQLFDNMRITSISISKDNEVDQIRFNLTARQIRVAEEAQSDVSSLLNNPSSGLNGQTESETDKGTQEGDDAPQSLLSQFFGGG